MCISLEKLYVCMHVPSCPSLCNPMNWSQPDSSVHGIFKASILEWADISYSRGSSWLRDRASLVYPALAGKFLPLYHLGKIMQRKFQPELNCVLSFLKVVDEDQNCVLVTWKLAKASFPLIFSFCSHFNFLPQLFSMHWMKFTWILKN